MKNNDKKEILKDLSRGNDTTTIENNIEKLIQGEEPIKELIYYLGKCGPIMLLRIKSNLENYREMSKFKRSIFIPNMVVYISLMTSVIPVVLHFSSKTDYSTFFIIGGIFLEIILLICLIEIFARNKRITRSEKNVNVILYLVNFMLENKKYALNKYSKKLYTKNKKAPVKNTSAKK